MRQISVRRRSQNRGRPAVPQGVLQVQYVQQGPGLHKPELSRARAVLQDMPRQEVRA